MSLLPPPWLALGAEPFDPSPIALPAPAAAPPDRGAPPASPFRPAGDGLRRSWFAPPPGDAGALAGGGIYGLVSSLIGALQNLAAQIFAQLGGGGGPRQNVRSGTLSSVGDPHLAEHATIAGANGDQRVDVAFDSMTSHDDLFHAPDVPGGYRVSTTATAPDASGVTWNASATVHGGFDRDAITLKADGTLSVADGDRTVALAPGAAVTLSGGETVARGTDGATVVSASDGSGGTIATTLRVDGSGVDVTAQATNIAIGGDIILG